MQQNTNSALDIELHLLATAYFYGDFSILFYLTNQNSAVYRAAATGDEIALRRFASRNDIDESQLKEEGQAKYNEIYQSIRDKYVQQLIAKPVPIPESYLQEHAERALAMGHFADAHSALDVAGNLDKKVNEFIVKGTEIMQSKAVREESSGGAENDPSFLKKKIQEAVEHYYSAIRIKNPLGNQYQYLAEQLHLKDHDAMRKYSKYVETNLLKEIIEFSIGYLADDKSISDKIVNNLKSGKVRKLFLRYFASRFSRGEVEFNHFIENYKQAAELRKNAEDEKDYIDIQKKLLGRTTGDNEYFQFLRELAVDHPVSPLLVTIETSPNDTPYITPVILKSGITLMEFLELDKK
ncbi:hypothetical protein GF337_00195 [candidate division KSB1 bacterium]|nr:hypothetical protein [candidate division KSB1 bacterium]